MEVLRVAWLPKAKHWQREDVKIIGKLRGCPQRHSASARCRVSRILQIVRRESVESVECLAVFGVCFVFDLFKSCESQLVVLWLLNPTFYIFYRDSLHS